MMLKLARPNLGEDGIDAAVAVLKSGNLVQGTECAAFEAELAAYLGCSDMIVVSSGTAALHLALLALDIGPGDAVIVPDFTFPATANAVAMTGAQPVIVDVSTETYCMDAQALAKAIEGWEGPEVLRAILPVHEFGNVAPMVEIDTLARAHGLCVIEDAACALGASLGNQMLGALGRIGCFSFHPRKTLTTGEGGALAVQDPDLADRLRRLRNHGLVRTERGMTIAEPALNYRLTDFQAALGRSQLPRLDEAIHVRRALADIYFAELAELANAGLLTLPARSEGQSWQTFMVVLDDQFNRDAAIEEMRTLGVECNLGAQSLTTIGIYAPPDPAIRNGPRLYRQGLALPLYELLHQGDIRTVCNALVHCLSPAAAR